MAASSLEVEEIGEAVSSVQVQDSTEIIASLPTFFVLKSKHTDKYLQYIEAGPWGDVFLQFSGEKFVSEYTKFAVTKATRASLSGLVHIRSCYNEKYWMRNQRESEDTQWITANAFHIEEDDSKPKCTLFKPVCVNGDPKTIRLQHVGLKKYLSLWKVPPPRESCLYAGSTLYDDTNMYDVFTVIDWDSLFILPKHVAFKDNKGKYLRAIKLKDYNHLQFSSDDVTDPTVANEATMNSDGSVCIKSNFFDAYWAPGSLWVLAYINLYDVINHSSEAFFWPAKVDSINNIVALYSQANDHYCRKFSNKYWVQDCLAANVSSLSTETHIVVVDRTSSREIYNANFNLKAAMIYNEKSLIMAQGDAVNETQAPNTVDVMFHYTETRTSTWKASASFKCGVKTTATIGIPLITPGQVEVSAEFTGAHEWGEIKEEKIEVHTVYNVIVPPMTRVKVTLLATQATCRVPFSYTQRDTLINGTSDTYSMNDGIYTGSHCFDFKYETEQEELSAVM